jgi:hypothetical protein
MATARGSALHLAFRMRPVELAGLLRTQAAALPKRSKENDNVKIRWTAVLACPLGDAPGFMPCRHEQKERSTAYQSATLVVTKAGRG